MDVAASEFFEKGNYDLDFKGPNKGSKVLTSAQLEEFYLNLTKNNPIVSIEGKWISIH
jgi:enolase